MAAKQDDDVRLIEKALKAGLGIISLGEEKLGKLADELAKRGEEYAQMEESPVSRLVSTLSETGDAIKDKGIELGKAIKETGTGLRGRIEEEAREALQKVNFATKADLEKLRAEVKQLKKKLEGKKPAKKRRTASKASTRKKT